MNVGDKAYWANSNNTVSDGLIVAAQDRQLCVQTGDGLRLFNLGNAWDQCYPTPDEAITAKLAEMRRQSEEASKAFTALLSESLRLRTAGKHVTA